MKGPDKRNCTSERERQPRLDANISWTDVKAYPKEQDNLTAVVTIGSTEQHGPHLPLGVDGYEAIGIAEGLAEQVDLLVAPLIWYGDADHHLAFPGTFSLSSETVIAVLKDVY